MARRKNETVVAEQPIIEEKPVDTRSLRYSDRSRLGSAQPPRIIDPRGAKVAIFGLQGGGKTQYAIKMIEETGLRVLVYSPHWHDFDGRGDNFLYLNPYTPGQIERVLGYAKQLCQMGQIDGVFIDEFDMVFRNGFEIGPVAVDCFANHRHYNMCIIGISRRPQDIPAYFVESCKFVVAFALQGDNVRRKFNGLYQDFGDAVTNLDYGSYRYYVKEIGRPPVLHEKLNI